MSRSLRNESEDPDPQKERQDLSPTKRNESVRRSGLPVRIQPPATDSDSDSPLRIRTHRSASASNFLYGSGLHVPE
ncbi:hypothetical protein AVEN_130113-1 [Araneus ventricosus]|uniref:Uncharacterized protein n=1 Tax=Araneus ventricosus TaxID=182803 RepID=A0A4Y2TCQ7_ARAVE|nr:hypothetical protein AVEN_110602-1 [Araneus ventricosus]GBN97642.1 hypothetical protein AVEN_130113-1 [Araneus ventricosus]